jgi:hypothetical protein
MISEAVRIFYVLIIIKMFFLPPDANQGELGNVVIYRAPAKFIYAYVCMYIIYIYINIHGEIQLIYLHRAAQDASDN